MGDWMGEISTEKLEELEKKVTPQNDSIKKMEEFVSPETLYRELIDLSLIHI